MRLFEVESKWSGERREREREKKKTAHTFTLYFHR